MRPLLALALAFASAAPAQTFAPEWLVLGSVGRSGRSPVHSDAIEALIVTGKWKAPKPGQKLVLPGGRVLEWKAAALAKGRVNAARGGYALGIVDAEKAGFALLQTRGHSMVYVNGVPRAGNPYRAGWYEIPVALEKGRNEFLFRCGRGAIQPAIKTIAHGVSFAKHDMTLPHAVSGTRNELWLGIRVHNASAHWQNDLEVVTEDRASIQAAPFRLPPCASVKVPMRLRLRASGKDARVKVRLALRERATQNIVARTRIEIFRVEADDHQRRTFRSRIDGSVQYYSVKPAIGTGRERHQATPRGAGANASARTRVRPGRLPAIVLSCHGAGVEAHGQAGSYAAKTWCHIVAATNRRPFGFDWEDWGRLDALEVLAHAQRSLPFDPQRVYLTGHSMGGHGTWHLGATFPSQWAAIGPSAGWQSFYTYSSARRSKEPTAMQALLLRAASTSDTKLLASNYAQHGVYVLHGDADRNVPVSEARAMRKLLREFHRDVSWHEQPGAGHWWDDGDEPGVGCVDWQPMFDFFARRRLPRGDEVRYVDFVTANPGVSARSHWVTIEQQLVQHSPSRVRLRFDPGQRRFVGTTNNVATLSLDTAQLATHTTLAGLTREARDQVTVRVAIDGAQLEFAWRDASSGIRLSKKSGTWKPAKRNANDKGPRRYGAFKHAFANDFCFVVGTGGSDEEQRLTLAKALYDAETFWYRGNGRVEVFLDRDFDPEQHAARNVILYGRSDTNSVWKQVLDGCPVDVQRGKVIVGQREVQGTDLSCLLCWPRAGSQRALVGVVAGTGPAGIRLSERLPYFVSGIHYPDLYVVGPESLSRGTEGVRVAGFFGLDWSIEQGDFVWSGKER